MTDPQVVAADQVFELARQNGLTDPELFNYAKNFLLQNGMLNGFYLSLIAICPPNSPFWSDTYKNISNFMTNNSLMPDFYSYLLTVSPPIPPLP